MDVITTKRAPQRRFSQNGDRCGGLKSEVDQDVSAGRTSWQVLVQEDVARRPIILLGKPPQHMPTQFGRRVAADNLYVLQLLSPRSHFVVPVSLILCGDKPP